MSLLKSIFARSLLVSHWSIKLELNWYVSLVNESLFMLVCIHSNSNSTKIARLWTLVIQTVANYIVVLCFKVYCRCMQLSPLKLKFRHLFKNSWFNYNLLCSRLPCTVPDFQMVKHWLVFNMYIRISYRIYWFIYIVLSCTDPYTCSLHPESGICQAAFRRYFYNVNTRSCQVFTYGGCGGNDNRFNTIEECNRICSTS